MPVCGISAPHHKGSEWERGARLIKMGRSAEKVVYKYYLTYNKLTKRMNEKEYYYRLPTKTSKISLSPKGFSFETLMFIYCSIANITYDETFASLTIVNCCLIIDSINSNYRWTTVSNKIFLNFLEFTN